MCGIVGLFDPYISQDQVLEKVKITNHLQKHRGPDDQGFFQDKGTNFSQAMTRLSILGIEENKQPIYSNDGRYCLVYNGEIINFKELKDYLKGKGIYLKKGNSDTEVLLELLILLKEKALELLNGMFAFSFYDKKEKKILIARDRFGIKPLYFFYKKGFGFASELKSLLKLYSDETEINKEALSEYLSLMYIVAPNTIYKNNYKLKHGHYIVYEIPQKKITIQKWHSHQFKPNKDLTIQETKKIIKEKAINAIKNWSISDVPICNSLSGGLDSSTISSIMGLEKIKMKNYTIGFGSNDSLFDESELAKLVSQKYNQDHENTILSEDYLISNFDKIINDTQEPYGGGLPSWFVYEKMSEEYKVGFVGTGVDEFFGSYGNWQNVESFFNFNNDISIEKFKKNFFDSRCYGDNKEKSNILNFNLNNYIPTEEKIYNIFDDAEGSIRDKFAILNLETQLPDEFLSICDLFSMSHSLEIRPPFLDNDFTNFIFQIPSEIRTSSKTNMLKKLFKDSIGEFLPPELLKTKKKGFILPTESWLKNKLNKSLKKYLSNKMLSDHGLFKNDLYKDVIEPFLNRSFISSKMDRYHRGQTQVWSILMFQLWYEKHIKKQEIEIST